MTAGAEGSRQTLELGVGGMTCAACTGRVERALRKTDGVEAADVNLATNTATVTYDPARVEPQALLARVQDAGYEPQTAHLSFGVEGMTCAACTGRVERALRKQGGVLDASVNLATGRAEVRYLPAATGPRPLKRAVQEAGYSVLQERAGQRREDAEREARAAETEALRRGVIFSAVFAVPLLLVAMLPMLSMPVEMAMTRALTPLGLNLVMLALALPVLLGPGRAFYRRGLAALRHRSPDMNTLVMLGTGAAFLYSLVATFAPRIFPAGTAHVYYEASAVVITLVLLGKYFESRAKGRSSEAMRALLSLQPRTARLLRTVDGAEQAEDVPAESLEPGDLLLVRPGERVPADAEVLEGESYLDESMMTGEPLPVRRGPGTSVVGGTLNGHGALRLRVTHAPEDSALAGIVRLVEAAQASRPPVQALADRVVALFVPVVLVVAALTFLLWLLLGGPQGLSYALVNTVAVLIIACPCAMGLATPVSVMVGSGRAAELGALFRGGAALEGLQAVGVVALDKTGTLTQGRPALTALTPLPPFTREQVLALVAGAEAGSEHPIAGAIVRAARNEGLPALPASGVTARPGEGLEATVDGRAVQVGSERWMAALGHDLTRLSGEADALASEGASPLYAAVDGQLAALLAVSDPIKEGSAEAVAAMQAEGLIVVMLTGDSALTARAVGRRLGLADHDVHAELRPEDKSLIIRGFQREGPRVAFVGDGINDAPALAAADVGVAIGTGTDVAAETADVLLMGGDLRGVPRAVALSRAVLRNIRSNLLWAFLYNVLLIPVAAGALFPLTGWLLSPVLAAAAMGLSSVFVMSSALRLRGFGRRERGGRRAERGHGRGAVTTPS